MLAQKVVQYEVLIARGVFSRDPTKASPTGALLVNLLVANVPSGKKLVVWLEEIKESYSSELEFEGSDDKTGGRPSTFRDLAFSSFETKVLSGKPAL